MLTVNVSNKDAAKFNAIGYVTYKDFGAKCDGKTDDIDAIAATHAHANQEKLTVEADKGATYFISGKNRQVKIQTDTDFGTASFIIDDTKAEKSNLPIFVVSSANKAVKLTGIPTLKKNQHKLMQFFGE